MLLLSLTKSKSGGKKERKKSIRQGNKRKKRGAIQETFT